MNISLAVFDMDGTILDTLEDLADAVNAALSASGFPARSLAEVRGFVGNGIGRLIDRSVPLDTSETARERVLEDFTAYYKAHCTEHTAPYPDIPELLCALRAAGIKTAVVSNKADFGVQTLAETFFPGLFDAAVGERPGIRRKPAPDAVNAVLQTLNIPKAQAVYIGDSDVDIVTAQHAGIPCISVTWGFRSGDFLLAHGASRLVASAKELQTLLLT